MRDFDPTGASFAADPYAAYAALRSEPEPRYYEPMDLWLVSRFHDVARLAADASMVRSLEGIATPAEAAARQRAENFHDMPFHERFVQTNLLDSDGEKHRRLRRQVFGAFRETALAPLRAQIAEFVFDLLGSQTGMVDFIEQVAAPVPGHVIGALLGVPAADRPLLRRWSEDVVRYYDVDRNEEKKRAAEAATHAFHDYLQSLIGARRQRPRDDLLSTMIAAEAGGGYEPDELVSTAMLILMAGHGSSIDAMGSGLHLLLENPAALARLRADRSLLPGAIQEMFRIEPPLPFFHRHATNPVEIGGRSFPAGTTFGLLYASANRDRSAFADPDRFDIDRAPNRHLAFGLGAHLCLGNALARLTMEAVFNAMLDRSFALREDVVIYKRGLSVRGPERLRIELD